MTEITASALKSRDNLVPWEKGKSGNPAGRVKGSRSKLQENFLKALSDDFEANGIEAIQTMRQEKPADYVRTIASLMPKQLEIERPLQDMTDDELADSIVALREKFELTILLVEHHMSMVMKISDQVVAMEFGRKIAEGTPNQIQSDENVVRAYLGGDI